MNGCYSSSNILEETARPFFRANISINLLANSSSEMSGKEEPKWIRAQKRTFCKWVNVQLKRGRCQISDLETGFKTGVALCILCEQISGEKLPRKYNKKPKMEIHMLENLNIALKWLNSKVKLVGIGSRGLYEGETKQTLGMLWTLILRFQVQEVEIDGLSGKKGLLLWCRRNVQEVDAEKKVNNFDNSWKDGKAFCALTAKFRPDLVDYAACCDMYVTTFLYFVPFVIIIHYFI